MVAATPNRRVILDVDDRGRVSLAKLGFRSMQVIASATDDGGIALHPAVAVTQAELAHYLDPKAVAALEKALASADAGRVERMRLRSDRKR
ncbi:MAG TPA: hypothetical protein DCY40_04695 [Actinobacteria bacterium]|nr:hypothetical protein [Actinomycetota bacterium]